MIFIIGSEDPVNPLEGGYSILPWGKRILKPTVAETINRWLSLNGCEKAKQAIQQDGGIKKVLYKCAKAGCEVTYIEVEGLGHVWPGGIEELPRNLVGPRSDKLNATDAIWEFFKSHPMTVI